MSPSCEEGVNVGSLGRILTREQLIPLRDWDLLKFSPLPSLRLVEVPSVSSNLLSSSCTLATCEEELRFSTDMNLLVFAMERRQEGVLSLPLEKASIMLPGLSRSLDGLRENLGAIGSKGDILVFDSITILFRLGCVTSPEDLGSLRGGVSLSLFSEDGFLALVVTSSLFLSSISCIRAFTAPCSDVAMSSSERDRASCPHHVGSDSGGGILCGKDKLDCSGKWEERDFAVKGVGLREL